MRSVQANASIISAEVVRSYAQRLSHDLGFAPENIDLGSLQQVLAALLPLEKNEESILGSLIAVVTIGETYFLRHTSHFSWIAHNWLPARLKVVENGFTEPLRILSAGCATGEEAYSIAGVILRALNHCSRMSVEVVGIDINSEFLQRADRAEYGCWSLRGVSLQAEADWLSVIGGRAQVRNSVRRVVRFTQHNLLEPIHNSQVAGSSLFDLIVCRNVLIYLSPNAVDKVYRNLVACLSPDGSLLVGPSDPSPSPDCGLNLHWEQEVRIYRREAPAPAPPHVRHSKQATSDSPGLHQVKPPPKVVLRLGRILPAKPALRLIQRHLDLHPLDVEACLLGAMQAAESGELQCALELARRATFLAPHAPYAVFVLGHVFAARGDARRADRYFRWAKELLENREGTDVLEHADGCTARQLKDILHAQFT